MREIMNPGAYYAAIDRRIKQNATITRRRNFLAQFTATDDEFLAWLSVKSPSEVVPELVALHAASVAAWNVSEAENTNAAEAAHEVASAQYHAAEKMWRKRVGYPAEFLRDALDTRLHLSLLISL